MPEFSDSTLLEKNVSHLVREQHLLLYLHESIVNQWRHQWSKIALKFQNKVKVSTGICGICLLLCFCVARAVTWTACKSSMEWCWDGEKCLKFHQWNDVAIAHFASEKLRSLRKSKMCHVCHVQKRESWLSATCWRSFDLQLVFFLHLACGCNLECACRECLAKNEVSPAPPRMLTPPQKRLYKEYQKLAATHCNSDFPDARNETTFAPKMKYSQLTARWPRSRPLPKSWTPGKRTLGHLASGCNLEVVWKWLCSVVWVGRV